MNPDFYTPEELNHILVEMKAHHHRDMLLCIDEILTTLDMASPAKRQWKAARRHIQFIEGNKFANQPIGSIKNEHSRFLPEMRPTDCLQNQIGFNHVAASNGDRLPVALL